MGESSIELNELDIASAAAQQQHFFVRKSESESESEQQRWKTQDGTGLGMMGNPETGSNVHLYRDSSTIHVRQALVSNPKAFARVGSANPTGCSHLYCHRAGRS